MLRACTRLLQPVLLGFALWSAQLAFAAPVCTPLAGFVLLEPDPTCAVITKYQQQGIEGVDFLGARGVPDSCFSVKVRGPIGLVTIGTGSAGLTTENHISPLVPSFGATPSILVNEQGLPAGARQFFTARSAIDLFGGRLFSADAGVIFKLGTPQERGTEQLLVTAGTGPWLGASGEIYVRGKVIQAWAPFTGQVCKP